MAVVPLPQPVDELKPKLRTPEAEPTNWLRFAASGVLIAGGLLLLTDRRRAGLVACASGTALAMLDQQDTLRAWWDLLPGYIDDIQEVLDQVQGAVAEVGTQRQRLHQVLSR